MEFDLIYLIACLGSGAFGAAVGGQPAFILTGCAALIGVALVLADVEFNWLGIITFGPVTGPHVSFGGAVAAAAYAARKGNLSSGRDIATPVMGDPGALLVGAVFGAGGYLCNQFLASVLDGASYTDTIAVTVVLSAIVVRLIWGNGLFGTITDEVRQRGRYAVGPNAVWVPHQASYAVTAVLGLGAGLVGSFAIVAIYEVNPEAAVQMYVIVYSLSAISLLLLQFGQPGPVTHHITLPAALVTGTMLSEGADPLLALIVGGIVGGVGGGLLAELSARVFQIHGTTHIDPPAIAIALVTSFTLLANAIY